MRNEKIKITLRNIEQIRKFINTTEKYRSDIDIMTNRAVIDAKSIIWIFALDLNDDIYVRIISDDIAECRKFAAEMADFN